MAPAIRILLSLVPSCYKRHFSQHTVRRENQKFSFRCRTKHVKQNFEKTKVWIQHQLLCPPNVWKSNGILLTNCHQSTGALRGKSLELCCYLANELRLQNHKFIGYHLGYSLSLPFGFRTSMPAVPLDSAEPQKYRCDRWNRVPSCMVACKWVQRGVIGVWTHPRCAS